MHGMLIDIEVPDYNDIRATRSGSAQCTDIRQTGRKIIAMATVASNDTTVDGAKIGEVNTDGTPHRQDRPLKSSQPTINYQRHRNRAVARPMA